jgi:hypothetical protein
MKVDERNGGWLVFDCNIKQFSRLAKFSEKTANL